MSYLELIKKEKELFISLKQIRDEKRILTKTYKNCRSEKDKLKFILSSLKKGTINQIIENIIFLDPKLTYDRAKFKVNKNIEELYENCEIGTIKLGKETGYYLLKSF